MANDLIIPEGMQLPAYLQQYETETNASLITQRESLPRISLKGKLFRFKKDGAEQALSMGQPLNVVILAAGPPGKLCAKSFYADAYQADSDDPPDCSSPDGIRPDPMSENPQADTCAMCPNNQWGSATDQQGNPTRGKACHDVKKLYVVPPSNPGKGDIFQLQVPTMSLKALTSYGRELVKHKIPVEEVISKISFVEEAEYPQIKFALGGFMDQAGTEAAVARAKSDEVKGILDASLTVPAEEPAMEVPDYVKNAGNEAGDPPPRAAAQETQSSAAETQTKQTAGGFVQSELEVEQDSNGELDKAGVAWDPNLHSANKTKTANGLWRKRKGAKEAAPASQHTQQEIPEQMGRASLFDTGDQGAVASDPAGQAGGYFEQPSDPSGVDLDSIMSEWSS